MKEDGVDEVCGVMFFHTVPPVNNYTNERHRSKTPLDRSRNRIRQLRRTIII